MARRTSESNMIAWSYRRTVCTKYRSTKRSTWAWQSWIAQLKIQLYEMIIRSISPSQESRNRPFLYLGAAWWLKNAMTWLMGADDIRARVVVPCRIIAFRHLNTDQAGRNYFSCRDPKMIKGIAAVLISFLYGFKRVSALKKKNLESIFFSFWAKAGTS